MVQLKKIFQKMFNQAMNLNKKNILDLLEKNTQAIFLDLGCDDGEWTIKLAMRLNAKQIYGIDIVRERIAKAKQKGIKAKSGDLNCRFPFSNNMFDVVHANQVIEHIYNLDLFVSEINRILKPGGYVIISTENASSWHNIFASIMGWQIFSLTNISSKRLGIGNPFAIHRGSSIELSSWTHKTIFNYRGLLEFLEVHNFTRLKVKGAGYYPFPAFWGNYDKHHAHFLLVKAYKDNNYK